MISQILVVKIKSALLLCLLGAVADGKHFKDAPKIYKLVDTAINKTYLLYNTPTSWMEASEVCDNADATLVRIRSQEEQEDFALHVLSRPDVMEDLWINGRQAPCGLWQLFKFGEQPTVIKYHNFVPGCPRTNAGASSCISIHSFYDFYWPTHWSPSDCEALKPFACEK